ncbi:MAG TPA: c-type cytochrome, partial [Candidatus Omnitrophota bacterium]|nr:c-type cytochrome [Candidatus Omnitrophota bacterium]
MAKQNPILYSVSKTFVWFAIISIILTGCLVAIVLMDHGREWKTWQKKFIALKASKIKDELSKAEKKVDSKKLAELTRQQEEAEKSFKANKAEYIKAQNALEAVESQVARVKGAYQDQKQYLDSYRYYFEEYTVHHDGRAAEYQKKLKDIEPRVSKLKLDVEGLEAQRDQKQAVVDGFLAKEKALQKEIDKLLEDKERLSRRLSALQPSVVNEVLNAPMLDFLAPTLEVQQVVLEDLHDNYHFAKVQKVDRCMTCHLGIDQKGFENAPQPFRTHPNLDRYLGSDSPHPIEKFGCTVCHSGNGHSVSFKDTAHTPKSEAQKKEWEKKYGWKELEKWEAKMLPSNYIEAACAKCHTNLTDVPMAPKLNQGRKLAETMGCLNCHKVAGFEESWKVGPDLQNIGSKVDPDWVNRWLQDPASFRPSTTMPKIFHLSNSNTPEDRDKNNAAIEAITFYLMKNSGSVPLMKPPVPGDSVKGETLVKELGCLGCHSAAGVQAGNHGPELSGLGSKVSGQWLYSWLKDPKSISHSTSMPNLRLSDQEAADITAYLLSLKNDSFEKLPVTPSKPEVLNALILENLQSNLRREEAEAALAKMSPEDRLEYLGKKSIAHQGCYTCHSIKGFEDAKPIGTELTHEGSKDIHQFDFGFTKIDRTRHDWIVQKLKDPRIYDHGKVKGYYEKLRMPQFNLSDED